MRHGGRRGRQAVAGGGSHMGKASQKRLCNTGSTHMHGQGSCLLQEPEQKQCFGQVAGYKEARRKGTRLGKAGRQGREPKGRKTQGIQLKAAGEKAGRRTDPSEQAEAAVPVPGGAGECCRGKAEACCCPSWG